MNDLDTRIEPGTVRLERRLPGPLSRAWEYFTRPERMAEWLAQAELEPRAGGRVELRFDVDEVPERRRGGAVIRGEVTRWDPPGALGLTWADATPGVAPDGAAGPASEVEFQLEERGDRVVVTVVHGRLPDAALASVAAGWHTHLAVLDARMNGQAPPAFVDVYRSVQPRFAELAGS